MDWWSFTCSKVQKCATFTRRVPIAFSVAFFCVFAHVAYAAANLGFIGSPTNLNFGTLQKPASGSRTFTVSTSGGTSGTGTLLGGTPSNAQVTLRRTGSPAGTISLSISNINTGSAALTLGSFTGLYGSTSISSFPRGALADPGTGGGTVLKIGATATYTSSIGQTSYTPTFDIVAVYE